MITAWRICKTKHAASAFDGYGARVSGGRWNSPGKRVVYTAAAASGAFLEMLVHADASIAALSYVLIPVTFHETLVTILDPIALPGNWREDQVSTRAAGDGWLDSTASAIMSVPSAILDVDQNYLINPQHPNMNQLQIGPARPLMVDSRIKALFAAT